MSAVSSLIAAAGIGLSVAGTIKSTAAAQSMAHAQQDAIAAQRDAEKVRQQQMTLDAARRRRETIRQGLMARSLAEANATSQGAELGSGLQGGIGQIAGRTGTNLVGINQNEQLGNAIFADNQASSYAYQRAAGYGAQLSLGQGLSTLGNSIITNIRPLTNITNTLLNNRTSPTGGYKF